MCVFYSFEKAIWLLIWWLVFLIIFVEQTDFINTGGGGGVVVVESPPEVLHASNLDSKCLSYLVSFQIWFQ